jgi:hypothetical protein
MPSEFAENPHEPETETSSRRGGQPPNKRTGADLLDPIEVPPPSGLVHKRWHISFWLGIALVLGAVLALLLASFLSP